jgi:hypothetical protein
VISPKIRSDHNTTEQKLVLQIKEEVVVIKTVIPVNESFWEPLEARFGFETPSLTVDKLAENVVANPLFRGWSTF